MIKIPRVFKMDPDNKSRCLPEVTPGCEWVLAGEGVGTRKYDGTACRIKDGKLYKRYDAKQGKTPPVGWEACQDAPDEVTGHWPGWLLVGDGPEDKYHRAMFELVGLEDFTQGTYELCGPKIQGNPERFEHLTLVRHGADEMSDIGQPCTYESLRKFLETIPIEGIVFHHPDGRMAKIRRKDFGFEWPVKESK